MPKLYSIERVPEIYKTLKYANLKRMKYSPPIVKFTFVEAGSSRYCLLTENTSIGRP